MTLMKWILGGVVMAVLAFGGAAAAESCVERCQEKANSCADGCSDKLGESFDACQLSCAKSLFVSCFDQCSETGVVIEDDYEVRPAEEPAE